MPTMFDYLDKYQELSFLDMPFNDIDALILTQLIYLDFSKSNFNSNTCLKDILDEYFLGKKIKKMKLGLIVPKRIINLADIVRNTKRYKDLHVDNYLDVLEDIEQFGAITYKLDDKTAFIAFRGTDDTLIGWYEDLYGTYNFPYPSQIEALNYVKKLIEDDDLNYYIGGHSKGGNLASYSYLYLSDEEKKHIIKAYDFDGQGFPLKSFELNNDKLVKILPSESIIGRLMNSYPKEEKIIKTAKKGLYAHDATSWQIDDTNFDLADSFKPKTTILVEKLNQKTLELNEEEQTLVLTEVKKYFSSLKGTTLLQIKKHPFDNYRKLKKMNKNSRKILKGFVKTFIKYYL